MSPSELRAIQTEVAALASVLQTMDLDGAVDLAVDLMEQVRKTAQVVDPLVWAKSKDTHIRMIALMQAAQTFKNTVDNIKGHIPEKRKPSPIILPA